MASRLGVVARCLQLVSQQIGTMPLRFRGGYQPLWVSNPDPVWFPGGIGSAVFAAAYSMYAWGDAFLWVTSRYQTGYPQTWTVLDPAKVVVEANPRGGRTYRIGETRFATDDILQITRDPKGGLRGTSALEGYAGNVASAAAAEAFAAGVYNGGGIPWAVLQPSRRVTKEQAEELQAQWLSRSGQRNGAPAVLPPDVAYKEFAFNPKDLMLLESREWDAKQIAAAYGVPAFMLNMEQAGGLNYSNPEMLFETWWRAELYPAAHRVESHLSTWVPSGSWVEFDPSILLSPDLAAKQTIYSKALADGVVTEDEYRAAVFDLPPLSEGEALPLIDEPPGAKPSVGQPSPAEPPALEVVTG
ncbi:MAG TPA: phage portal protein [Thermomicrobiales bacterium]|jgi:HK97 family phage portal protein